MRLTVHYTEHILCLWTGPHHEIQPLCLVDPHIKEWDVLCSVNDPGVLLIACTLFTRPDVYWSPEFKSNQ